MIRKNKEEKALLAVAMSTFLMFAGAGPTLAQQGPEVPITDSAARADQPDIALDSNGNAHIVYCDEYNTSEREIWYTMLDNDGNTLIEDTMLTVDDGYDSTRPAIVIGSDAQVHILWRDQQWEVGTSQEVTYMKLDPALDDMDGSSADPETIIVVDVTRLSDNGSWKIYGIRAAIDSKDDIHIVWDDDDVEAIYTMKVNDDGAELVAETVIREAAQWRALPDIAVDSNDNLHVTWTDYEETDYDEIYYMMLAGDGATLIDATLLTVDDGNHSKWTTIVVDYEDKVHIIFQDQRGRHHEIYHTKIDPALDDMDGDAADGMAITLIDDHALTPDDGWKSRHPAVAIYRGRYINITWDENENESGLGPDVGFILLDSDGAEIVAGTMLTTTHTADSSTDWTMPYLDVDAGGKAHIVWCDTRDSRDESYEVYYTTYTWAQIPTCDDGIQNGGETGVDCGGGVCPDCPAGGCCDDDGCGCAVFDSERNLGPGQFAAFGLLALVPFAFVVLLRRRLNR
ncbi:hypothetical protein ACFL4G_04025 [Thermodesulfobacteriota bacterium]